MKDTLERMLKVRVSSIRPVAGGDINDAYCVELSSGERLFVKTRAAAPASTYACEAQGLDWLRKASALRLPRVLRATEELLVLEWIKSAPRKHNYDMLLGHGLARLHQYGAPRIGLDRDNFIGTLPQTNRPAKSFAAFYAEQRILPLVKRAQDGHLLSAALVRRSEQLCARLPSLLGGEEPPARLHGDLWSGNVMSDERGEPVLVDPAVYGGHREVDLAMLSLFGSPSRRVFDAYDEVYPRAPGAEERTALFQLYPLLVHLCLFGAGYLGQVSTALAQYN